MTRPNQHQAPMALQSLPASVPRSSSGNVALATQQTQQASPQQNTSQTGQSAGSALTGSSHTIQIGSLWANIANNAIMLLLTAIALAIAYTFGKIAARQGDLNLRATLWRDCIDLPDKVGDTLTCKKLLAGGFDSLSSRSRSKRSLSSQVRQGGNWLVLFWLEISLIEDRFILNPLLWTLLLAADLGRRFVLFSLAFSGPLVTARILDRIGVAPDLSCERHWICMAFSLCLTQYMYYIQGSNPPSIGRTVVEELRCGFLFSSLAMFIPKLRPYSIQGIMDRSSAGSVSVCRSGLSARVVTAVIELCILGPIALSGSLSTYGSKVNHEVVNRWKDENADILCIQLTALLISLLILRIPYAWKLIHLCQLMLLWGCSKIPLGGRCSKVLYREYQLMVLWGYSKIPLAGRCFKIVYHEFCQRAIHQWAPVQRILETQSNATLDFEIPTPESVYLNYIRNQHERTSSMTRL